MKQYVIDAFTDQVFQGNPAAVCLTDHPLPQVLMQKIAVENNLSETAFAFPEGPDYRLRWFTPGGEINLCGHATLAAAYAITRFVDPSLEQIRFHTLSGLLTVQREGEQFFLDLPVCPMKQVEITPAMTQAVGIRPKEAYLGEDLVLVLGSEALVRKAVPDQTAIASLEGLCLHITAPGDQFDCVTRTFAPKCNVAEDPVCGRAHCHLAPFWIQRLGKPSLLAYQASARGGRLTCQLQGDRVILGGQAALYAQSELFFFPTGNGFSTEG